MAIKIYSKEYMGMLKNIFIKKSYFLRAFGGEIKVADGVKQSDEFMEVKISDASDVTIQEYDTGEDVGFGEGTGSTNRFGKRREIKSVNKQIPYEKPLSIHEGIDDVTVNDVPEEVIAERLEKHALAWAEYVDKLLSKELSNGAAKVINGELSENGITKVFAAAHKHFVNNNVSTINPWVSYVNTEVYDFLVDHKLTTTAKNSNTNIETQTVPMFKGFVVVEVPDHRFEAGEQAVFSSDNVGVAGVGLQVARAMDSEDFTGVALQGAGKYAKYLPDENKKAVAKAKLTAPVEVPEV